MIFSSDYATKMTRTHGSPLYIYDNNLLRDRAAQLAALSLPFGLTSRYAVKANPHPKIIQLFDKTGLHFDASSSYEAEMLLSMGVLGNKISLSSQQPAHNLPTLLRSNVQFVATSLHQLRLFIKAAEPGATLALRVNTGMGAGHNNRTTTAGKSASFGIWHDYLDEALALAKAAHITINRLHTHIGSGADPASWSQAIKTALGVAARMPEVTTLDMGGGYKIARMPGELETDMVAVAEVFSRQLTQFYEQTGRKLHLEIEPGTWLVAHAGTLLAQIVDIVDTGADGYTFLRVNTGMNDFLRPTLYGAQHDIEVLNNSHKKTSYIVVGHNCESGDILTTASGDPEVLEPRLLNEASIGDFIAIKDVGAYAASLRAHGYNAFPPAKEVCVDS